MDLACNDYGSASVSGIYRNVDIKACLFLDLPERLPLANPTGNLLKFIRGKLFFICDGFVVGAHASQLRLVGIQFNPLA